MIKTISLGLGLLKVCFNVSLESSYCGKLLFNSARLDRSKNRLDRSRIVDQKFFAVFSNTAHAHMTCKVKCFTPSMKRKNSSYVLEVFVELCVKSFVRFERFVPSNTHIELSRSRFISRTWWLFQLLHKEQSRKNKNFEWSLKVTSRRTCVCCKFKERSSLWT